MSWKCFHLANTIPVFHYKHISSWKSFGPDDSNLLWRVLAGGVQVLMQVVVMFLWMAASYPAPTEPLLLDKPANVSFHWVCLWNFDANGKKASTAGFWRIFSICMWQPFKIYLEADRVDQILWNNWLDFPIIELERLQGAWKGNKNKEKTSKKSVSLRSRFEAPSLFPSAGTLFWSQGKQNDCWTSIWTIWSNLNRT